MSELAIAAGIAAAVASLITAITAVVGFIFMRGRNEGGLSSQITALSGTVDSLKTEVESALGLVRERAEHAHERIDAATLEHHSIREMIAREYVTYERMRELKTELVHGMATLTKSQSDQLGSIHVRLDALIHSIAGKITRERSE